MHETGIVRNLIEHAARAAGERTVKQVHVTLGALSEVSPESLRLHFEVLSAGTPLAGAGLSVRREPGRARCLTCGREFEVDSELAACPECDSLRLQVIAGDRLVLEALDVDDEAIST